MMKQEQVRSDIEGGSYRDGTKIVRMLVLSNSPIQLDCSFGPTRMFGLLDCSFGPTRPLGELDCSLGPTRLFRNLDSLFGLARHWGELNVHPARPDGEPG
ncbi:hypothetical protein IGI04_040422 [Brassica rapa subsp. trilocularis]|uniref:Uncharacterized protein n=1 Tax=Brassica rapa subsp. trilocularis TaxID=1813537 RepID=A0ABQ7KP76_BRACM|nr:hypothetical protein IGI04_040422 [Brassica rapa subsp. trilocularis]